MRFSGGTTLSFLTPAVKFKGAEPILLEIAAQRHISAAIEQLAEHIDEFIGRKFHGRSYKGIRYRKESLRGLGDAIQSVNSVAKLLNVLQRIEKWGNSYNGAIKEEYARIKKREEIIKAITNLPCLIILLWKSFNSAVE